ncbi:MAG: plasmid replication protein RepC [Rhodopila sp.]
MHTDSACGAQGEYCTGTPTGFRRLTLSLLQATRAAEGFTGLPPGVSLPGQILAAFKAAATRLGLAPRLVHASDWLFRFTQPQDWEEGARPIVWPSAALQREALGLSETQVKAINRTLIDAGLITMKDSPNGKRYGRRDSAGRITEAYGFDLSPLAARYQEFIRLAAEAKAERTEMGQLRRRATIARKGIIQILETAAEQGFTGEEWTTLSHDSNRLTQALRRIETLGEMTFAVGRLERWQREARERLENLLAEAQPAVAESSYTGPKGPEYRPHQHTYKSTDDLKTDAVIAHKDCSPDPGEVAAKLDGAREPRQGSARAGDAAAAQAAPVRTDSGPLMRLTIDELLQLAPRLRTYLTTPNPVWRDIVGAADWLRGEMGISRPLWGEACLAMGRECAAVAVALVSAKPAEHFRTSRGGYFHGMVAKAKAGELNLVQTIWGLRQAKAARERAGRAMH